MYYLCAENNYRLTVKINCFMKNSVVKSSKMACNLGLALWSICTLVFVLRLMRYLGIITVNVYLGIDIAPIAWYPDDPEAQIAQWIELVGYILTTTIVLFLTLNLIIRTRMGIKVNRVFSHSNAKALMCLSGIVFFNILFTDNLGIIYGSRSMCITSNPFVYSLVVLIVAMLYKMAVSISDENELTI